MGDRVPTVDTVFRICADGPSHCGCYAARARTQCGSHGRAAQSRHLVTLKLVDLGESSPECANLPVVYQVSGVGTTPTELLEKVFPGLPVLQSLVFMRAPRRRPVKKD